MSIVQVQNRFQIELNVAIQLFLCVFFSLFGLAFLAAMVND